MVTTEAQLDIIWILLIEANTRSISEVFRIFIMDWKLSEKRVRNASIVVNALMHRTSRLH